MAELKWNADLYDTKHGFVSKYGEDVLAWLSPQQGETVLDVGCGTGTLTEKISEAGAIVTGIDASEDMVNKARESFPGVKFFVKDATNFSFDKQFDAAFSNATFHWIKEQSKVLECIYNSLRKGGRLVYEMGAKHNIESIHKAVKQVMGKHGWQENIKIEVNYFSSAAEQAVLLEKVGFTIANILQFERPTELIGEDGMKNWIIQFGSAFFKSISADEVENLLNESVEILRESNYKNGKWYADYIRLRVKAIKK